MKPTPIESQADLDVFVQSIAEEVYDTPQGEFHAEYVAAVESQIEQRFLDEVAPNGQPHPALAASTIRQKGHARILQDTNRLLHSLTDSGHPDAVVEVIDEPGQGGLSRGTDVPYSAYHNTPTANRPARPHVGLSADDALDYCEASLDNVFDHLTRQR
ncbi:MAG: phage virion morphogenesis protein [Planctomycetota bacterium]